MSIREQVLRRIRSREEGWVFTPSDFLDLGSHYAIGMALGRLIRAGHIQRIARGMYHRPRQHPKFGPIPATPEAILAAITRRDGSTFRETGASAANKLQLSEQVPMRLAYETDGQSRRIEAGGMKIDLIHRRSKQIRRSSPVSQLVFSALRERRSVLGDPAEWTRLGALLSEDDKRRLLKDLPLAPGWMHRAVRTIAEGSAPLDELVRSLVHAHKPWRLYLFGSRARGGATAESDYDLLMVLETLEGPSHRIAQAAHSQTWGLGISADILVISREEFEKRLVLKASLPATVVREGRLVHSSRPLLDTGEARSPEQG